MLIEIPKQLHNPEFRFIKLRNKGKEAIEREWNSTNNYRFAEVELTAWRMQGNNYGVCGGFGGLVIIDSDSKEVEEVVREYLPNTFRVITAHGIHNYFICRDLEKPIRLTQENVGDLGDVQAKGKYVVGPSSIHPSGKIYQVENDIEIAEVDASDIKFALRKFLEIEDDVKDLQKQEKEMLEVEIPISKVINISKLTMRGNEFFGSHPIHGSKGGMNFWVNSMKNVWHCFRHDSGGGSLSWIAVQERLIDCKDARKGMLKGKVFSNLINIAKEKYNLQINIKKDLELKYFEGRNFISKRLGDEILANFTIKTLNGNEIIFNYEDGVYKDNGEVVIKETASRSLGELCKEYYVKEVIFYVKSATFTPIEKMNSDILILNLKNGLYNIENHLFMPHSKDIFSTVQLSAVYDVSKDCPKIKQFLSEVLIEDDIKVIQELFGYCLWKAYPIHKAFMFIGDGANGKSTLINLLKTFLGNENISSVALQEFESNRFATAELFGRLANLYADLPDKAMFNTGRFKMLTGEDVVGGEKKFKGKFNFTNYAKLVFSCNKVPEAQDDTGAFFRRWIFINFPNKFEGENCKPNLLKELTTEEELSGLLNWALEGLERLLKQGHFSTSKTTNDMRVEYERRSSSVKAFGMDCLEEDSQGQIEKDAMYGSYIAYCKKFNVPTLAKNTFGMKIKEYFGDLIRVARVEREGLGRVYCWVGVNFKDNSPVNLYVQDVQVLPLLKLL